MPAVPLVALAFVAGTLEAATLGGSAALTLLAAAALALGLLATRTLRRDASSILPLVAAIALAGAGHARFEAAAAHPEGLRAYLGGVHRVVGGARADAAVSGTTARVDLDIEQIDGAPSRGGVRLSLPAPNPPIRGGDRLEFTYTLTPRSAASADTARYLEEQNIDVTAAYPPDVRVTATGVGSTPVRLLRAVRRWSLGNLERSLPEPAASLAAGLLLGEQRTMPANLTDALRATGTSHLAVVSGHTNQ